MKASLRAIVCAAAMFGVIGNLFADAEAKQQIEEIVRKAKAADAIEIVDMAPDVTVQKFALKDGVWVQTDVPRPIQRASLSKKEDLRQFVDNLKLSDEFLRPGVEAVDHRDGKTVTIYPPCLCLGDFECRFSREKKELLRFTIHHDGGFIRIKSNTSTSEFDLFPPAGSLLNQQIKDAMKKASLDHAPGSTPSSVTAPAAHDPRQP